MMASKAITSNSWMEGLHHPVFQGLGVTERGDPTLGTAASPQEDRELYDRSAVDESSDSDIEWETDWKRLQRPKLSDLKGKELYMALCTKYGALPMRTLERGIDGESIVISHCALGPAGARAMSAPLCASKSLRILKLEDSMLGQKGAAMVARVIYGNPYITEIDLSNNKIGSAGAAQLCSAIQHSVAITKVILTGNEFEDSDGEVIAEIIDSNVNIKELVVAHNRLSVRAGQLIAQALINNDTIETLDLSWNQLRLRGAHELAQALAVNRGLKVLNVSMNGFSIDGARSLGNALCTNKYLEELDISFNRISTGAAIEFSKCLKVNSDLRILMIHGNPITREGVSEILGAISSNKNSSLNFLDIRDLSVQKDFMKTVKSIQQLRIFEVRIDMFAASRKAQSRAEEAAGKAVVDLLQSLLTTSDFCNDGAKTKNAALGKHDILLAVAKAKIPLTARLRDRLMSALAEDEEGVVNMRSALDAMQEVLRPPSRADY